MRIACIGECMVELTLPAQGSSGGRIGFAGDTLNAAVYLARASGPDVSVSYVTALGNDALSDRMLAFFEAEGLETGLIERRDGLAPGLYAIDVDEHGERSFTYWRENSAARSLFATPARIMPEALAGFDLIYLSGITLAVLSQPAREALRDFLDRFRADGGRVAFDSNYRPKLWPDIATARREISELWQRTDIALPSLDDEMALWGDADAAAVVARLVRSGVRAGALKRGAEGPLPIGWSGPLPVFNAATQIVDTTAAGDSFNGGYLAARLQGVDERECLAAGHALASRVIGCPGAIIPR